MRIFVGLDIDDEIRERIARFIAEMRALAPDVRWVAPESLHVTLKFIGEKPDNVVKQVQDSLSSISATGFDLSFRGCGFFPTAKSARVFWVGIDAGTGLAKLASQVEDALVGIGIPKEARAFSPHLTLARAGSGAPRRRKDDKSNMLFAKLQQKLTESPAPEFGTMSAREFFLYRSQLSSQGSRYTKIASFALHSAADRA
jgi:2'-5' RNA ligase